MGTTVALTDIFISKPNSQGVEHNLILPMHSLDLSFAQREFVSVSAVLSNIVTAQRV